MNAPASRLQPLLSIIDEDIGYDDTITLKGVSLSIVSGEKVAIVGQSGSGKTTLLKRLYQLRPSQCAFIHQQYDLVPQLTTFHNIYMGRLDSHSICHNLRNLIKPTQERLKEIIPIAKLLGLEAKLKTRIGELSGGQQQRVGIGRALYRGGEILMADEPVSSLDTTQQLQILATLVSSRKTVISSLHSIDLANRFFTRMIALKYGSVFFDLPVGNVKQRMLSELYQN